MLTLLALILAATPIPVNRVRVPLDDAGAATVESKPGSVSVRFERDGLAPFTCAEFGKVARWEPYVAYLRDVATQAPSHPSADFGLALSGAAGVVGSSAPGYCNAAASTRDGVLILVVIHNRACYGSAGCVTDTIAYLPSPDALLTLADAIAAATVPTP